MNAIEKVGALIMEIVHSVKSDASGAGDGPNTLEQTAHCLCEICGENTRFANVAKVGVELLGQDIDDSVTAVLFDMLDAPVKVEEDEEDDDSVMEMSVDENEQEDDQKDNEESDAETIETSEETTKVGPSVEKEASVGEDGEEDEGDKYENIGEDGIVNDGDMDVGIDPDMEDPAVLAAVDTHLSKHMKLLFEKKAEERRRKLQANAKAVSILNLISAAANNLRIRVERKDAERDEKTVAMLFDVFLRLVEFLLSSDFYGSIHVKRVISMCDKQMSRKQLFVEALRDKQLILGFSQRLCAAVTRIQNRRRLQESSVVLRRLASVLLESLGQRKNDDHEVSSEQLDLLRELSEGAHRSDTSKTVGKKRNAKAKAASSDEPQRKKQRKK